MSNPKTSQFNKILIGRPSELIDLVTKRHVYVWYKTENKHLEYKLIHIDEDYFETFRDNVFNRHTYENEIMKILLMHDITPYHVLHAQLHVSPAFYDD